MGDFEDKILAEALKLFTTGGATIYSQDGKIFLHKSFKDFLLQVMREVREDERQKIRLVLWSTYDDENEVMIGGAKHIEKHLAPKE